MILRQHPFFQFVFLFVFSNFLAASPSNTDLEIWEVQGTGNESPFDGQMVRLTNNVVTVVTSNLFYMQSTSSNEDGNPATSDGILVFVGDTPDVFVGDIVNVEGFVEEFNGVTTIDNNSLVVTVISTNQGLPEPVIFDENFPGKTPSPVHDLETVEGMWVEIQNAIVTAPTSPSGFLSVTADDERPFREPGIIFPGEPGLPVWDGNPEVFELDLLFDDEPILTAGTMISATGVISQGFGNQYEFLAVNASIQTSNVTISARERNNDELSIGCINGLFLDNDFNRVQKMANYIMNSMNTPDIIAFQEIEDISVLESIANRIEIAIPNMELSLIHI